MVTAHGKSVGSLITLSVSSQGKTVITKKYMTFMNLLPNRAKTVIMKKYMTFMTLLPNRAVGCRKTAGMFEKLPYVRYLARHEFFTQNDLAVV
mmetsp:Transcript_19446/g.28822  ORF Transcript_19446/g.28822 Transcript_19446/m.28822 type:complete len:93 (+) Transcript_19446:709-987(+)